MVDVSWYFRSLEKVENGLHLLQVWCTAGSLVFVDEAEVSSGTVIDKLDSGIEGWGPPLF